MLKKVFLSLVTLMLLSGMLSAPLVTSAADRSKTTIDEIIGARNPHLLSSSAYLSITEQDPFMSALINNPNINTTQAVGGAAAALIPYRSPAANFSRNILVSQDYGHVPYQTEPHLSVNPNDPNHLVVGMIDYNFPGVVTYTSFDGGATWQGPIQPKIPRTLISGAGDPVTVFDKNGNVYICQMAISYEKFEVSGITGYSQVASIVVNRSSDGGLTWNDSVTAGLGEVYSYDYEVPQGERPRGEVYSFFVDKPWMAIGPNPSDPSKEILYLTYTLFIEVYSLAWIDELPALQVVEEVAVIEMVRSEDGGRTWSEPVAVSPYVNTTGHGDEEDRLVHGSQPMVGPDGTVYVAYLDSWLDGTWQGNAEIMVATSKDKGQNFTRRSVAHFIELDYLPRSANFRFWASGFPQTAMGPNGEIYITYVAYPSDKLSDTGDIFMVASLDGGKTYSIPKRVNDDTTDHLQFFPSIAAGPDGKVHLMWGDTRDDISELAYHIYYSVSSDNGKTWEFNSRVTDYPSNPNLAFPYGGFLGDYFSMKVSSTDVYMVWADSRLGEVMGANQKIAFARQKAMPTPQLFLSPPSGPAGRDIIVQGSNFQPDSEIFISLGGVLISTGFTDASGNFMQTIYAPVAGEGARDVVVADISGNVSVASFFTEFGFDTFQTSLNDLSTSITGLNAAPPPDSGGGNNNWLLATLSAALFISLVASGAMYYRMRLVSSNQ